MFRLSLLFLSAVTVTQIRFSAKLYLEALVVSVSFVICQ
jgi:hypothetical protein